MEQRIITCTPNFREQQGFVLAKRSIPAGLAYCMHWHTFLEFEIIVSGQAQHIHNSNTSIINDGYAYLMGYNDFHSLTAISDMELYCIHFSKNLIAPEILNYLEFNQFQCQFSPEETHTIVQTLLAMEREQASVNPFRDILIQNLMEDILIKLIRKCNGGKSLSDTLPVRQAIAYLNSNFRKNINLELLAKEISLSPNYLGQLFKTELGISFNEYLNKLRLKFACDLLTSTKLTAKEIAFSAGYNSVEYFMYIFKKNILMTPAQYRKNQGTT